jgi:GH15 family glucan-1,4-alpha-glucosidase
MKPSLRLLACLLALLLVSAAYAQVIHFDPVWRFATDDKPEYKNASLDDTAWKQVVVPSSDRGREGFGWYRTRFTLPKEMLGKEMVLFAGTIDAVDETYINGTLVGKTGKFATPTSGVESCWDQERMYVFPAGIAREENTLAIRMYNEPGIGGIYKGRLALMTRDTYEKEKQARAASNQSYFQLTTSNGLIAAVYNKETDRVEALYPHIFSTSDENQFVDPFAHAVSPDTSEQPVDVTYAGDTHVIQVNYPDFAVYYFAPFTTGEKIFYAVARGKPDIINKLTFRHAPGKTQTPAPTAECVITKDGVAEKYFLIGVPGASDCARARQRLLQGNTSLVDAEIQFMRQLFATCRIPAAATDAEKQLLRQSIAFLKMSQVADTEIYPHSHGQVLASLLPGPWNTAWVRDGSFAIAAMARLGMAGEARKGLEFMLNARPAGRYVHYLFRDGKDYGIGVDSQISATRYFGNGKEECDSNEDGPNIEIDDFGLFLIALDEYLAATNDTAFYKKWQDVLARKVADAIIHNIDKNGMIRRDSGPWEHHLPGRQYTFTSGVCAEGLKRFAAWQKKLGYPHKNYAAAADRLTRGILQNAVYENRLVKGDAEDQSPAAHYFHDAGTFELFACGLLQDKALFTTHMEAYDKVMKVKDDCGYIRVFSDDTYENQEWPFADLRVAVAHLRFGNKEAARQLIDKVTRLARANYGAVPEIYRLGDCYFRGSIPMIGYGSGAYALALLDLYAPAKK